MKYRQKVIFHGSKKFNPFSYKLHVPDAIKL